MRRIPSPFSSSAEIDASPFTSNTANASRRSSSAAASSTSLVFSSMNSPRSMNPSPCRSVVEGISRRSARIAYCGLFALSLVVSWILREVAVALLESIPWISHFHQTPNREWFETDAVLRVSLGNYNEWNKRSERSPRQIAPRWMDGEDHLLVHCGFPNVLPSEWDHQLL
ncbi:hypothetical protein QJS04_geneDACA019847 [Acorus gramineus]|uniref:Uncharacterized protein n=1 Tax=Acorus gramineus TaxID=55184 RepID=A0AAV9BVE8_ACOGR|nr:hypothetical protein QJS04_geneDACA019847 [Acorus gramineus]